jgi:hypothetical protein
MELIVLPLRFETFASTGNRPTREGADAQAASAIAAATQTIWRGLRFNLVSPEAAESKVSVLSEGELSRRFFAERQNAPLSYSSRECVKADI